MIYPVADVLLPLANSISIYIYADSHSLAMAHNTLHQAYTIQCPLIKLRLINENDAHL